MPLDPRDRETLRIFASGGVSAIPAARVAVDRLLSELDRIQSDRSMRMERLREELTWTEAALNALAFAAGVDYGTARADLERAAAGPEIDGVSGAYRYAASLVERAVDRAGRPMLASLADRVARLEALAGAIARLLGVAPDHLIQRLMLSPNCHAAAGQVAEELRARCLPVVEWRTMLDGRGEIIGWAHDKGSAVLRVAEDGRRSDMFPASRSEKPGWVLAFVGEYSHVADSGPETGEVGKAAAVAAWRRVCGLEVKNPGA